MRLPEAKPPKHSLEICVKRTLTLLALFITLLLSNDILHAEELNYFYTNASLSSHGSYITISEAYYASVADEDQFDDESEAGLEEEFEDDFDDDDFDDDEFEDDDFEEDELKAIADPLEPLNRVFFAFNDKLYFWILKPVARGYNVVIPEPGRVAIGRFFTNLRTPIRMVNALLQFKIDDAGTELFRFGVNSTIGILGFMDPAKKWFKVPLKKEDTGQTLGFFRLGPGFYIVWPVIGPSSLRDTVGLVGDSYLNPWTYYFGNTDYPYGSLGVDSYRRFNDISLNIGMYEGVKEDSLDPYIFIRDAYHQHREHLIGE